MASGIKGANLHGGYFRLVVNVEGGRVIVVRMVRCTTANDDCRIERQFHTNDTPSRVSSKILM